LNGAFSFGAGETNGLPSVAKSQRNGLDGVEACWKMNRSEGRHLRNPQVSELADLDSLATAYITSLKTTCGGWSFYGKLNKKQAFKDKLLGKIPI